MKKKYLSIVFLIIGLILISLSIILAIIATVNKDIIKIFFFIKPHPFYKIRHIYIATHKV